jgi:hypothetical protein
MTPDTLTFAHELILAGVVAIPGCLSAILGWHNKTSIKGLTVSVNGRVGDLVEALKGRTQRAEDQLDDTAQVARVKAEHSVVTTVTQPTAEHRLTGTVGAEHVVVAPVTVIAPDTTH